MTDFSFQDSRLRRAAELIASGEICLLSLDIFDTLLGRRVPRPPDVFLHMASKLRDKKLLGSGIAPDSFAAIRYQTEYAARGLQQRAHGTREVTLAEIYALVPKQAAKCSTTSLVAAEIQAEHDLCFANTDVVNLARFAKEKGIKFALITNSFYNEKMLRRLLKEKAPELPEPDGFFVSCEQRMGKRDGLMRFMLERLGVAPRACLHIGDDPVSDKQTAEKLGVTFIDFSHPHDLMDRLTEEHPIQWHDRADRYATVSGDFGLTWWRRLADFRRPADLKEKEAPFYTYGTRMMGPLLCGFTLWAAQRAREEKAVLFGLTREGDFLNRLGEILDKKTPRALLATGRLPAALASFAPGFPQHLEDFLTRRGTWTHGALLQQLGFDEKETRLATDPTATLEDISAQELTRRILASPLAEKLFAQSQARRQRLLKHLEKIGALKSGKLFLFDLGYAATIQRALQRIFTIEKLPIQTHGLYMLSVHVSLATQAAGGIVEGFLAQNGNPNDFARAFCRSPEIVELSCMPPYGTVADYTENGDPVFADEPLPAQQISERERLQRGVEDCAQQMRTMIAAAPEPPDFCAEAWKLQMRDLATRLVVYPSEAEARMFGSWHSVADLGLAQTRTLLSTGPYADKIATMTAGEIVNLPRRELPWLYGIAASLGYAKTRQVASLMLRKERPEAF